MLLPNGALKKIYHRKEHPMKQRFSKRTRLVSALLTLAMVFTFLPFSAFAANTEIAFDSPDFALEFPDAEFQRFLRECCDKNNDGKLDADIQNMTIPTSYRIKSLKESSYLKPSKSWIATVLA